MTWIMKKKYVCDHGEGCSWSRCGICTCGLLDWLAGKDNRDEIMPDATVCVERHRAAKLRLSESETKVEP